MKQIPYNITDYKKLILEDYYYVDKTKYLNDLQKTGPSILYLRPRRFGKTLFTSMMYYYYDINSKDLYDKLFKETYIYTHQEPIICDGEKVYLRNSYYILRLDFSSMNEDITTKTKTINQFVEDFNEKLDDAFNNFITHYGFEYIDFSASTPANKLSKFLRYITSLKLGNKLYIIIDEYDTFSNSILRDNAEDFLNIVGNNGFVKNFYALIKSKLGTLVDRVFITGVCSVSLDSMTSGFNVATNITVYDKYNEMTALTYEEVHKLIDECVVDDKQEETYNTIKENYDGYKFSEEGNFVFNPNLTMYYLSNLIDTGKPPKNLLDTNIISNYDQIKNIIKLYNNNIYKDIIKELDTTNQIVSNLKVNFELKKDSDYIVKEEDIISLLFYFGYLTLDGVSPTLKPIFKIPNQVIKEVYNDYYLSIIEEENNITLRDKKFDKSIEVIMNTGDIIPFLDIISNIFKESGNLIYTHLREVDLQAIISGILSSYQVFKTYMEYSSNDNFIDIMILKNEYSKYNVMIELKYIKKNEYTDSLFNKKINDGIEQINKYMSDERIPRDNTRYYVVVFTGSEYKIREINNENEI